MFLVHARHFRSSVGPVVVVVVVVFVVVVVVAVVVAVVVVAVVVVVVVVVVAAAGNMHDTYSPSAAPVRCPASPHSA